MTNHPDLSPPGAAEPPSLPQVPVREIWYKLRDSLGQVAACKRLLKADGVAVIVADALGPIPAGEQKRNATVPQHVGDRETQPTSKVDVENRKIEHAVPRQRQRLIEAGGDRRDL